MLNGNELRSLKELIVLLYESGHCTEAEAKGYSLGVDAFASFLVRTQAGKDQENEQHFLEAAALRAFEMLLPHAQTAADGWKEHLAVEAVDAAAALAKEIKHRARLSRSTAPPPSGVEETELTELFGREADGSA